MPRLLLFLAFIVCWEASRLHAVEPQAPVPQLNTQTHWYGNTWGGGSGPNAAWFQQTVEDLAVADGRIYAIAGWDEHCGEASIYSTDGAKLTVPEAGGDWPAQFHSWGYSGGPTVTTSGTHVFYSMGQNGEAKQGKYSGVARYTRDGKAAGWKGALGNNRLKINDDPAAKPKGLAVRGDELFVSDPAGKRIAVFGLEDLAPRREISFAGAGRMVVDATPEHGLWVIDTGRKCVVRVGADGTPLGQTISDCLLPVALAIDPRQGDLLVADGAPERQCIRRYASGTWKCVGKDLGGPVWAGPKPGLAGPARFYGLRGIACDQAGNLYVADYAFGAKVSKFDPAGKELWIRKGLEFVTCADADPGEENSLYSAEHRYVMDLTKPPGESWREVSLTVDPLRYPQDPRLKSDANLAVRMFRREGQRLMMGKAQMGSTVWFWRFDGEIAVPAGGWWPAGAQGAWPPGAPAGAFIWSDTNGDGAMQTAEYTSVPAAWFSGSSASVDAELGLLCTTGTWDAGKGSILHIPAAALTKAGAPTWDVAKLVSTPIPTTTGILNVSKLTYDPLNDRMYLGCFTTAHPFPGGGWEQMNTGPVLQRLDHWSTPTPTLAWERLLTPPEGIVNGNPKAWSFEQDYAFVAYSWKHEQLAVDVWRLSDGVRIGRLLPTAEIGGVTGWIDMNDAVQSHRRNDGSYLICAEEVWMAKGLVWNWKPGKP